MLLATMAGGGKEEILHDFDVRKDDLDAFGGRVEDLFACSSTSMQFLSIPSILGSRDGPALRGRSSDTSLPTDSLEAITDLLGARIITYFSDEVVWSRALSAFLR